MRYCQACHRCFNDGVEYCLFDQTPTCEVERLPLLIDGKYRLEQLIAHGGMGSVYRALHLQLERPVAIKILRAEFLTDETVIERFKREARAAARLRHPNVIAVYDFGLLPSNGGAYLVMELIEGRSLREEMRANAARHGQMRCERAVALMRQVCAGVECAHQHGIIHRDLKPDNIMIETEPNGAETVKVLDFGIAKLKENEQTLQSLTEEGTFIGTPNYISPEQCTSLPVDARSDVYSLGVILYEMLTGRVPFSGSNTSTVLIRHLQEPPTPPSRFRADLSQTLEQAVLRALAKSPGQRHVSAAQFSDRLDAAVRIENYDAAEPETRERQHLPAIIPFPARQAAAAESLPTLVQTPTPQPAMIREPQLLLENRSRPGLYLAATVVTLVLLGIFGYAWQQHESATAESSNTKESEVRSPKSEAGSAKSEAGSAKSEVGSAKSEVGNAKSEVQTPNSMGGMATRAVTVDSGAMRTVSTASGPSVPVSLVKPNSSPTATPAFEEAEHAVRATYAAWAITAARGDWKRHLGFYADRVDYYRDGAVARAAVEARKRRAFQGLNSFWLRFDDRPQITFKTRDEAEVVFDKQWALNRGRQRAEGKSRVMLTLRRDAQGWRIAGERQLKLYSSRTVKR